MNFIPLAKENINEAIKLVHSVFPEDALSVDSPEQAYRASLDPIKYNNFYVKHHIKKLEYFVVMNEESKIIGVTGFYTRTIGPADMIWLGWYCVDPFYRGMGLGRKILEWTIAKAKEKGFKIMRLYTSTDPNESEAQKLYEKLGFVLIDSDDIYNDKDDTEMPGTGEILYREKNL